MLIISSEETKENVKVSDSLQSQSSALALMSATVEEEGTGELGEPGTGV